jgi:hypothetical protein
MSQGPQKHITIPPHWWEKLDEECRTKGIEDEDQLCARKPGVLHVRTIKNAKRDGWMTATSFRQLAKLLDYPTSHALKDAWNKAAEIPIAGKVPITAGRTDHQPENPKDRTFTTQENMPQWADHLEIDLKKRRLETLSCTLETDSPYFRFGFKLMSENGRMFGDGSIQSHDANLVVHIGRNNWDRPNLAITAHDIFLTWFQNGVKRGKDARIFSAEPHLTASVKIAIDSSHVMQFLVNGKSCLSAVIPPEIRRRAVMIAWGDSEEYEVRVSDIRVQTIPVL